jgi:hypothetical protein
MLKLYYNASDMITRANPLLGLDQRMPAGINGLRRRKPGSQARKCQPRGSSATSPYIAGVHPPCNITQASARCARLLLDEEWRSSSRDEAEGAGVEPARLFARPRSRRVPSPIG